MKTKQEQIEKMAKVIQKIYITKFSRNEYCLAQDMYNAGYRKASDVIDEFVERINLIECEMFHKAHDVRNFCEYKIDHGNTDDRVWGDKRACEGGKW